MMHLIELGAVWAILIFSGALTLATLVCFLAQLGIALGAALLALIHGLTHPGR